jgi:hypothetical protein
VGCEHVTFESMKHTQARASIRERTPHAHPTRERALKKEEKEAWHDEARSSGVRTVLLALRGYDAADRRAESLNAPFKASFDAARLCPAHRAQGVAKGRAFVPE